MDQTTPTARFSKAFDPSNMSHVKWLGDFFKYSENLANDTKDISHFINKNPMGQVLKQTEMMDWVQIHFALSMKYTQHVFKGTAFIPPSSRSR